MPSDYYEGLLDRAAELWGIVPEFWDIWGRKHITGPETKRAILGSLGIRAGTAEELERELEERARREEARLLPACTVASVTARPLEIAARTKSAAHFCIRLEDGGVREFAAAPGTAAVPYELPLGYHEIEVESEGRRESAPLIVTPDRAFAPRGAGSRNLGSALRPALAAQLGLRRLYRSGGAGGLGREGIRRELHRAESAARHSQPAAI